MRGTGRETPGLLRLRIGAARRRSEERSNGHRGWRREGGACPAGQLPNQEHCLWWVPAPAAAAGVGGAASTPRRPPAALRSASGTATTAPALAASTVR